MSVLGFEVEWFDQVSGILQTLYLKFFLDNNTIELLQNHSTFLKRIFYPEVTLRDLYIGNSITVYNRLLVIKKYANSATTEYMTSREVRFLCLINKDGYKDVPKLMIAAKSNKLTLGRVITTSSSFDFEDLSVNSGDCLIELIGLCIPNTKHLLTDMRNMSRNVDCIITDADSISVIFKDARCSRVVNPNCSLCVIKPHVVRSQQVGEILKSITDDRRFQISALFTVHLTTPLAEELFEVYRGIVPNYTLALEQICSAPVLAVMITTPNDDIDVVTEFRSFVGPLNPALAKVVRPQSLRALYGVDETKNAVHCTDMSEDGEMECKYIFETIASL